MKICLIINPGSGSSIIGNGLGSLEQIINFFLKNDLPITVKTTVKENDATVFTRDSVGEGYTHIIACGGDGTINEVLNGMVGSDAVLGIIPLGTENILAKAMDIPLDPVGACRHFLETEENNMDIGLANDRYFLIISGIGLDARVLSEMEKEEKKQSLGKLGYVLKAATMLFWEKQKTHVKAKIKLYDKGVEYDVSSWLILVGNLAYYGGNVKVALNAKPDDGLLDIIVFPFSDNFDIAMQIIDTLSETHLDNSAISYYTSSDFEITTDPPAYCQVDGELLGETPIHYSVKPGGLRVKF